MKVPFLDLKPSHKEVDAEVRDALGAILDRCDFVLGQDVREFEAAMRDRLGVKCALAINSGTDALILALRALGVGPGDAVITSPFTFFASSETVNLVGAEPIFCDIEPCAYNLSPDAVETFLKEECDRGDSGEVIEKATGHIVKALMPVHIYGQCADMKRFLAIGREYGLPIIEDAAQALGAKWDDSGEWREAGVTGLGCYSFYPSKNLGAYGDAGMLVSNDEEIYKTAKKLHVHGSDRRYYHDLMGYNSRMDSFQAAVLRIRLQKLDGWIEKRRRLAALYFKLFREKAAGGPVEVLGSSQLPASGERPAGALVLPDEKEGAWHTYNSFNIRADRRDGLSAFLTEREIGNMIYYPVILPVQNVYAYLEKKREDYPAASAVSEDILCLPLFPGMTDEQAEFVAGSIVEFLSNKS